MAPGSQPRRGTDSRQTPNPSGFLSDRWPLPPPQADLFAAERLPFTVDVDDAIRAAAAAGAVFAFNLSGGKDSGAASDAAMAWLDAIGHPRARRVGIHADLGRAEWRSTPATVGATAERLGLPLVVVRRQAGDLVARWQVRFANAKARYAALETYNLIGPWSQADKRFCTSELKTQVIGPELARRFRGETIVQVLGLRRAESRGRAGTPVSKPETRYAAPGNAHGTRMLIWNPVVRWSTEEVFAYHARQAIPLHEAYTAYGSTRLSCAFCVLASLHDLGAAAAAPGNLRLLFELVALEAASTFSFQPERWLADVAPGLLPPSLVEGIAAAKRAAAERRAIEAAMPAGLRYLKGWPPRLPTPDEAAAIAAARRPILAHHGLTDRFPDAAAVTARFAELMAREGAPGTRPPSPAPRGRP